MKLILKIANHSWVKGENARWSVAEGFDRDILSWVKKKYAVLEHGRPEFETRNDKTVFLFYHDDTDIYDRNITEITAVVADCLFVNPAEVRRAVEDCFKHKLPSDLEIAFSISSDKVVKPQFTGRDTSRQRSYGLVLAGFIVLLLVIFFFSGDEDTSVISDEKLIVQASNDDGTETHSTVDSVSPNNSEVADRKDRGKNAQVEKQSEADKNERPKKTIRDSFCEKFGDVKPEDEEKYFCRYIKNQCNKENERFSYDNWLLKEYDKCLEELGESPPPKCSEDDKDLTDFRNQFSRDKLINNFFDGK